MTSIKLPAALSRESLRRRADPRYDGLGRFERVFVFAGALLFLFIIAALGLSMITWMCLRQLWIESQDIWRRPPNAE